MIQWYAEEGGRLARFGTKGERDTWVGKSPDRNKLGYREKYKKYDKDVDSRSIAGKYEEYLGKGVLNG